MQLKALMAFIGKESDAILYLKGMEVIEGPGNCLVCGHQLNMALDSKRYWCPLGHMKEDMIKSAFFQGSKQKIHVVLQIGYLWLMDVPISSMVLMTGLETTVVSTWIIRYRILISEALLLDGMDSKVQVRSHSKRMAKALIRDDLDHHPVKRLWEETHGKGNWDALLRAMSKINA